MSEFEPTIGQAAFGAPHGEYAMSDIGEAAFWLLWREIERVFWNVNQREFNSYGEDPGIPGIVVNSYYWGDEEAESARPNFAVGGLEIRWYKYPGRGMSCDRDLSPAEWSVWLDSTLVIVRSFEKDWDARKLGAPR